MMVWLLLLFLLCGMTAAVKVEVKDTVIAQVSEEFLSFTVDDAVFYPSVRWGAFNFSSLRLLTLMRGLSPAIWRIGGSPADYLVFDIPQEKLNTTGATKNLPLSMTKTDWDNLITLSKKAGVRLLFDLDLQQRLGRHWGINNAVRLFDYCQQQGYGDNLDWELGNEPNVYGPPDEVALTPQQLGEDFITLAKLVHSYKAFAHSRVVGPDVVGVDGTSREQITGYVLGAGDYVDALTIHQYYFRGDTAAWTEYLKPAHFKELGVMLDSAYKLLANTSHPNMELWLGETSDAWHSGTPNVSDRYVSAFLWLDKLGVAAQYGVKVVMRQTFWGHQYGLINDSLLPNPDYWLSLLHKRLVGQLVLSVETSFSTNTRIYAHCASTRNYSRGAVTVFMLNINTNTIEHVSFSGLLNETKLMHVYLMRPGNPGDLLSQTVSLNGKLLKMMDDQRLLELRPDVSQTWHGFDLPPTSYAFLVFPNTRLSACL